MEELTMEDLYKSTFRKHKDIKFRIWDVQEKRFMSNPDMSDLLYCDDAESFLPERQPYHIICQYTGKKDINNVEIYEGDVVALYDSWFIIDKNTGEKRTIGTYIAPQNAIYVFDKKPTSKKIVIQWKDDIHGFGDFLSYEWGIHGVGKGTEHYFPEVIGNVFEGKK